MKKNKMTYKKVSNCEVKLIEEGKNRKTRRSQGRAGPQQWQLCLEISLMPTYFHQSQPLMYKLNAPIWLPQPLLVHFCVSLAAMGNPHTTW